MTDIPFDPRGFAGTTAFYERYRLGFPDRLLARMLHRVGWIFRPCVLVPAAGFIAVSFLAAIWNFDRLVAQGVGPVGLTPMEVAVEIRRVING